jgi:indolepyruvate ferredoxin oxidoreductase
VDKAVAAEKRAAPGKDRLAKAVARSFAKIMAYKDEYEVARLYSDPKFLESIKGQFEGSAMKLSFNLAPPLFARKNRDTGLPVKREYGPWMLKVFPVLARMRKYRGSALDIFGRTGERRAERALIDRYEREMARMCEALTPASYETAVRFAALPEQIRGFGHVKEASMAKARSEEARLIAEFDAGGTGKTTIVRAAE